MDWMGVAERKAKRSKCRRKKTGAVIVSAVDTHRFVFVIANNHLPVGVDESVCDNCPREDKKPGDWSGRECPVIHAEVAAILKAARIGVQTNYATMFCTYKPCMDCARTIVEAGITDVYYRDDYPGGIDVEMYLREQGVTLRRIASTTQEPKHLLDPYGEDGGYHD